MGATTFGTYALGKTAADALDAAQKDARYEYGNSGYSGTIAEKSSYALFKLPPRCTVGKLMKLIYEMEDFQSVSYLREDLQWARNKTDLRQREAEIKREERRQASFWRKNAALEYLLRQIRPIYDDKWGPAVALEVTGTKAAEIKKQKGRAGTHDRVFYFCGWASC